MLVATKLPETPRQLGNLASAATVSDAIEGLETLSAQSPEQGASWRPRRTVLFCTTDDELAQTAIDRLVSAAGFGSVKAGGPVATIRIEMHRDLHDYGSLSGRPGDAEGAPAGVAVGR